MLAFVAFFWALGIPLHSHAITPAVDLSIDPDYRPVTASLQGDTALILDGPVSIEHAREIVGNEAITKINFTNCYISRRVWEMVVGDERITWAVFYGSKFEDPHLEGFEKMAGLKVLSLGATNINRSVLAKIAEFKHLKVLNIGRTEITGADLRGADFSRLEDVTLGFLDIGEEDLQTIIFPSNMRLLDVGDTKCTTSALRRILNQCEKDKLEELVYCNTSVDDEALKGYEFKSLISLEASGVPIGPNVKRMIASAPKLNSLYLTNSKVTDADAELLKGLHELEVLVISENQIGVNTIREIARLPKLRRLGVASNKLESKCFEQLSKANSIKTITLSKCDFKFDDLKAYFRASQVQNVTIRDVDLTRDQWLELIDEFSGKMEFDILQDRLIP